MPQDLHETPEAQLTAEPQYLTVAQVVRRMTQALDEHCGQVSFTGEIGELTRADSGHLYFTVKDGRERSQISGVMWSSDAATLKFRPKPGDVVLCHGRPVIYAPQGRLQLSIRRMQPWGKGALLQRFLELKDRLEKEGLFAQERKRPLPFLPRTIGVVTSGQGAAIQDIMVRLRERMPHIKVYLADVRVQGEGAAAEIAQGIKLMTNVPEVEVLIVGRGGGSQEDLWAFNEEVVVRAIFASPIPVVSAVGHEVDFSLSDFVADVRAPTPTAAAEMVVPHRIDLMRRVDELARRVDDFTRWLRPLQQQVDELAFRLDQRLVSHTEQGRLMLRTARARLEGIQPARVVALSGAKVDALGARLGAVMEQRVSTDRRRLERMEARLERISPQGALGRRREQLVGLERALHRATQQALVLRGARLEHLAARAAAVSPQAVLERGFAIVTRGAEIVRSSAGLAARDTLEIAFHAGQATAEVRAVTLPPERTPSSSSAKGKRAKIPPS